MRLRTSTSFVSAARLVMKDGELIGTAHGRPVPVQETL